MQRMSILAVLAALVGWTGSVGRAGAPPAPAVGEDAIRQITAAAPKRASAKPARPRRLLVFTLCQGARHGSIPYATKAIEIMGRRTGAYETVVTDDVNIFSPQRLKAFDAVLFNNTTGRLFARPAKDRSGADLRESLLAYLASGKGIAAIHAAADGEMGRIIGGRVAGHPWDRARVKIDEPDHPLNAAFAGKAFEVRDEICVFGPPYSRSDNRVLLSVDVAGMKLPPGGKPPRSDNDYAISWVRRHGKGRIFYCSLGGAHHVYRDPKLLRHYLDGIQFALGDLEAKASPDRLTPADAGGWIHLFDGTDLSQWVFKPGSWAIAKDGSLARRGGGDIHGKGRFGDFVLDLEFKMAKGTNSGIFIRTGNPRDPVQTGMEIQVLDSFGKAKVGRHDCGALYDCVAPSRNVTRKAGEWNHMVITCKGSRVTVMMNGEGIIDADLDRWTRPGKNPDGSGNKFRRALKDFPRRGHIMLQDHGRAVWYRKIKVKPLSD